MLISKRVILFRNIRTSIIFFIIFNIYINIVKLIYKKYKYTARILLKKGKFKEANDKFEETIQYHIKYHIDEDVEYVNLLGDYGEVMFEKK